MADVINRVVTSPVALGQTVAFRKDKGKHDRGNPPQEPPGQPQHIVRSLASDGSQEGQGKGNLIDIRV